ncbi:MAG: hypothetical protein F4Z09_03295 [Rhodobacteraceae bacterium]|nr:hypothetical protein [Paracoccaceae bacterium]MYF45121.1 hypothetical protein [Paracoccaceae bacterium]
MKILEITENTYQRLEMKAKFNETAESVILRLLDQSEIGNYGNMEQMNQEEITDKIRRYGVEMIPELKFTKLLDASFGDKKPEKINWNELLKLALTEVMKTCKHIEDLIRISGAKVVAGRKENEGYKFIPTHRFSFQGVNAVNAAGIIYRCANYLGYDAYFEFEWRQNKAAYKPGERASLKISSELKQ